MLSNIKSKLCVSLLIATIIPIVAISEDIQSYSVLDEKNLFSEQEFIETIQGIIIVQPEFRQAISIKNEYLENKKYASRLRFPTISAQILNDRTISNNIRFANAIRKTKDDSLDGQISIDQPIYTGNETGSKIRMAKLEISKSSIELNKIASELILNATDIYLSAASTELVANYCEAILEDLEKFRTIVKKRFDAGIISNSERAIVNVRLSEIASRVAILQANKIESASIYLAFFKREYNGLGLPKVKLTSLLSNDQINLGQLSYSELLAKNNIKNKQADLELTKSSYRPKLGFQARYTRYDLDEKNEDNDIRGGFYFNIPLFNFGRGSAQVSASRARIEQARVGAEKSKRDKEYRSASVFGSSTGSLQARNKILDAYTNVRLQRETFLKSISSSDFSVPALLEAASREINIFEQLVENEKKLLLSDLQNSHLNRSLLSRFRIKL